MLFFLFTQACRQTSPSLNIPHKIILSLYAFNPLNNMLQYNNPTLQNRRSASTIRTRFSCAALNSRYGWSSRNRTWSVRNNVPRTPPPSSSKAQSFSLLAARSQSRHEPTIVVSKNELTITASERVAMWNRRGPGWYWRTGLSQQVSSTAWKWKWYYSRNSAFFAVIGQYCWIQVPLKIYDNYTKRQEILWSVNDRAVSMISLLLWLFNGTSWMRQHVK